MLLDIQYCRYILIRDGINLTWKAFHKGVRKNIEKSTMYWAEGPIHGSITHRIWSGEDPYQVINFGDPTPMCRLDRGNEERVLVPALEYSLNSSSSGSTQASELHNNIEICSTLDPVGRTHCIADEHRINVAC